MSNSEGRIIQRGIVVREHRCITVTCRVINTMSTSTIPKDNYVQREGQFTYGSTSHLVLDTAAYDSFGDLIADQRSSTGGAAGRQDAIGFGAQWGNYGDWQTGLQILGHRYYDPGTGRFLNRDPIGYTGGINLYGYAGNNPVNYIDPDGTSGILIFVHGTLANDSTWTFAERNAVEHDFKPDHVFFFSWAYHSVGGESRSNASQSDVFGNAPADLTDLITKIKEKYVGHVAVVAHSNGGNVAVRAAQNGAPIDLIVRLGSPPKGDAADVPPGTTVFDVYDLSDPVSFKKNTLASLFGFGQDLAAAQDNWIPIEVHSPGYGVAIHLNMTSPTVWYQVRPALEGSQAMQQFR